MTRKEEIIQKANEMIPIELVPFKKYFIRGAEWADRTLIEAFEKIICDDSFFHANRIHRAKELIKQLKGV